MAVTIVGEQAKKPVLRLINSLPPAMGSCPETIAALEGLLRAARAGRLTGLAYCAIKGYGYMVDCVGAAAARPTEARGMVCALDDELQHWVQGRADEAPTHPGY